MKHAGPMSASNFSDEVFMCSSCWKHKPYKEFGGVHPFKPKPYSKRSNAKCKSCRDLDAPTATKS
jgi:hypothetical protein